MRRLLVAFSIAAGVAGSGCHLGLGPFRLPAVEGRVVDSATGRGVQGAEVVQWLHGAGRMGEPRPVQHGRWTRSDASGHFAFEGAWAPARTWLLRSDGPTYSTYHLDYGLVHAGAGAVGPEEALLLELPAGGRETGLAALAPYCRGERSDPASRHLADIACGRGGAPVRRQPRPPPAD